MMRICAPSDIPNAASNLNSFIKKNHAENKRVSNVLIKKELGVELKFPNYKLGLRSLL